MVIIGIILGIVLIITGYLLAKYKKNNILYSLSALGLICLVISILYGGATLLMISAVDNGEDNHQEVSHQEVTHQEDNDKINTINTSIQNNEEISPMDNPRYELIGYNRLSEEDKILYDEMKSNIFNMEFFSYDTENYSYDELDNLLVIWQALTEDYPIIDSYFIMNEKTDDSGMVKSFDSLYYASWEIEEITDSTVVNDKIDLLNLTCDEIINKMPRNLNSYDQYLYLAEEISKRVNYDYDFTYPSNYTPCGLLDGLLICEGYSKSFKLLCQKADLWCDYVTGAYNGWSHMWNLIEVDGQTYHVDITWCDEQGIPGSDEWLKYFALTQDQIMIDHEITDN